MCAAMVGVPALRTGRTRPGERHKAFAVHAARGTSRENPRSRFVREGLLSVHGDAASPRQWAGAKSSIIIKVERNMAAAIPSRLPGASAAETACSAAVTSCGIAGLNRIRAWRPPAWRHMPEHAVPAPAHGLQKTVIVLVPRIAFMLAESGPARMPATPRTNR